MNHHASPAFWNCYHELPAKIRKLADKNFKILKIDTGHPSLHFKKVSRFYSARVRIDFRALALPIDEGLLWFWIGNHTEYNRLIND